MSKPVQPKDAGPAPVGPTVELTINGKKVTAPQGMLHLSSAQPQHPPVRISWW